jgi:predicted MFS family arabinose efflux permease
VTTVNSTFGAVRLIASRDDESRAQFVSSPNPENLPGGDDARMRDHSSTLAPAKASMSLGSAVGSKCRSETQRNLEAGSALVPQGKSSRAMMFATQARLRLLVILVVSDITREALNSCGPLDIGDWMSTTHTGTDAPVNTPQQVLFASLIGTAIEFFDFYIYATAAVLVFPSLFFPASATMASLATFGVAFVARPVGSALFGHFGDRIGRKATLVMALLTMGISTVAIGALPTYASIGFAAPLLLALCRFGQGLGLGGEWGGAVLLAIENAPPNKRAWYGMFPQLGAPLGFFLSGGVFLLLSRWLTDKQFFAFGWRLPFLASAVLVFIGLYVRMTITETPVFQEALNRGEQVKMPMLVVFRQYTRVLLAASCCVLRRLSFFT